MRKVKIEGYVIVADADLAGVTAALPEHIELTRQEPGCLSFSVTQDEHEPNKFHVSEVFVDKAAFAQHQARAKTTRWAEVSQNLERHYHQVEGFD